MTMQPDTIARKTAAAFGFMKAMTEVSGKIGVVGFCYGGSMANYFGNTVTGAGGLGSFLRRRGKD